MKKINSAIVTLLLIIALFGSLNAQVLVENFEGAAIPAGWTQEFVTGTTNWTYVNGDGTLTAFQGSYCARFYATTQTDVTKLVSPELDLSGLTTPMLTFYHAQRVWAGDQDTLRVYYKTAPGDPWTMIPGAEYTQDIPTWTLEEIILPATSSTFYIAFEGSENYGHGVLLDSVVVKEAPTCFPPTSLAAGNITAVSADLSWLTGGASNWNLEWGLAGTALGNGNYIASVTNPFTLSGLSELTDYVFYVRDSCGVGDVGEWTGPFAFSTIASCPAPTGILFSAITETSADVTWTGYTANMWDIEVGLSGFSPSGTPTTEDITGIPYTIGSLSAQTAYDLYVRADCGGATSTWAGPFSFTTACGVVTTLPFVEDFETPFDCWTIIDNNNDGDKWALYTTNPYEGSQCIALYTDYNTANDDWLISPTIALNGNERLRFWTRAQSTSEIDEIQVLVSTTGTDIASFTNVVMPSTVVNYTSYQEKIIDLSAFSGDVNIAFARNQAPADGWRLYIDYVVVEELPNCPDPADIVVSGITQNSADVDWSGFSATTWDIEFGLSGFTPSGIPTIENVTGLPYTISGLNTQTAYQLYVRADCGTDSSNWVGPVSFSTACGVVSTLPFIEDFENPFDCWTIVNNNNDADQWALYTTNPYEGSQCMALYTDYNTANDDWLISPTITLTGNERLRFWTRAQSTSEVDEVSVLISTTGTDVTSFTNTVLPSVVVNHTTYQEKIVDLSAFSGDVNLAFLRKLAPADGWRLYIDYVVVEEIPSCLDPDSLTALNINMTSADLSWVTGGASAWNIEWGEVGFTLGEGNFVSTDTNPYTVNGLTPGTVYEFYVQDSCNIDDLSNWVGPYQFMTPACDVADQCTFTFYLGDDYGDGWNGHEVIVYQDGLEVAALTLATGSASVETLALCEGSSIELEWVVGLYPGEPFLTVVYPYGDTIVSFLPGSAPAAGIFSSFISYCNAPTCFVPTDLYASNQTSSSVDLSWTTGGAANWNLVYGEAGFGPAGATFIADATNPVTISGLNPSTQYEFYVRDSCGVNDVSLWAGPFAFSTTDLCPVPDMLSVINITEASADLTWNGYAADLWDVEIGPESFVPTGIPTYEDVLQGFTAGSLSSNTTYDFYVRADCNAYGNAESGWSGPFTFTTDLCNAADQCYFGVTLSDDYGDGWNNHFLIVYQEGLAVDTLTLADGFSAVDSIKLCDGLQTQFEWIVGSYPTEPALTINYPYGDEVVSFISGEAPAAGIFFTFNASCQPPTCPKPTGLAVDNLTDVSAMVSWQTGATTWNIEYGPAGFVQGTGTYVADVTNPYEITGLIAETDYDVYVQDSCAVDDVSFWSAISFTTTASCPLPTDLAVLNLTDVSADLDWNGYFATTWDIEFDTTGFTPSGVPTFDNVTTIPFSVTGLSQMGTYEFYVRADCGTDSSNWSGPFIFTTPISNQTNPSACNLGFPIVDNECLDVPVLVSGIAETQLGTDVALHEVRFIATHTFDGDLDISLLSPNGVEIILTSDNGSSGENYGVSGAGCTEYTSLMINGINGDVTAGSAPFIGSYSPEGSFSDFNDNSDPNGVWILRVCDDAGGDEGTLDFVELVFGPPYSSETDIITYSFPEETGAATIDAVNHTVDIEVAYGSDLANLTATFTLSTGAVADIGGVMQISSTTVNDFTASVIYTVTAEDGVTTQDWTINVTEEVYIPAEIVISEIYYNPLEAGTDSTEFVELLNIGSTPANLGGYSIGGLVSLTFPAGTILNPGEYVVACIDSLAMVNNFGVNAFQYTGELSNSEGALVVYSPYMHLIDTVYYLDDGLWPVQADGQGYSLVFCQTWEDNLDPAFWTISATVAGTFGPLNFYCSPGIVDDACADATADLMWISPADGSTSLSCDVGNLHPVVVELVNVGDNILSAGDTIAMNYQVNGGIVVQDTLFVSSDVYPGDTIEFTYAQAFDAVIPGFYSFTFWYVYNVDENNANDYLYSDLQIMEMDVQISGTDTIQLYPYQIPYLLGAVGSFDYYIWENFDGSETGVAPTFTANDFGWYYLTAGYNALACEGVDSVYLEMLAPQAYDLAVLPDYMHFELCDLGISQIDITILNAGVNDIPTGDTIVVWYQVNSGVVVYDTIFLSNDFVAGQDSNFVFVTPADLSSLGNYIIDFGVQYTGDLEVMNDAGLYDIDHVDYTLDLDAQNMGVNDTLEVYSWPQILTTGPGFESVLWSTGEATEEISVTSGGWFSVEAYNAFGCYAVDSIFILNYTGVNFTGNASQVNVYPNPTNSLININVTGTEVGVYLDMMNLQGQVVFSNEYKQAEEIMQVDLSGLANGVYYLRVTSGEIISVHKIIKQ